MKVFIDTNIFLDLFLDREKFADAAESLLLECERGRIEGVTSASNVINIYYLVNQQKIKAEAKRIIRKLLNFVSVPATHHKDLLLAMESEFSDFEDAVQYFTALNVVGLNYIITRNKKDYKTSSIEVLTAEEFVDKFEI